MGSRVRDVFDDSDETGLLRLAYLTVTNTFAVLRANATDEDRSWGEILVAAALQGAVFALVKAAVDRAGASGVRKVTDEWPAGTHATHPPNAQMRKDHEDSHLRTGAALGYILGTKVAGRSTSRSSTAPGLSTRSPRFSRPRSRSRNSSGRARRPSAASSA
jgi:hypothetical protein